MKIDEYWVAEIVYDRTELAALDPIKRGELQAKIDSGDLILSGGEVSAPVACIEGEHGTPASSAAQDEALARCTDMGKRGKRAKVIANLDVEP